jgi:putative FmdB family regulatory protein
MPIYEYMCQDCGAQFEKFVRSITATVTATVEAKCPECGGTHTKKGWSVFGTGKSDGSLSRLSAAAASSCDTGGT